MKPSLLAALAGLVLLSAGCQSLNWTAKNKSSSDSTVAQSAAVREVPWSEWRKKKNKKSAPDDVPPEIAEKFEKSQSQSDGTKSATELVLEGNQAEVARNFPAARRAYESALQIDPTHADAHHRLGILDDMRQDYAAAQDHYEAALRQKPHDANLLSDFGYSHQLRGNANQSERYLLMALDLDGQHKQALKNLGSLYASQDRYHDAQQAFRRFRPEPEAQQLLAQYFPDAAGSSKSPIVAARTASDTRPVPPMPDEEISVETLKQMSPEQIFQLMEQRRQNAERTRAQKDLAEMRPNLQDALNEDYPPSMSPRNSDAATTPRNNEWSQEPSAPANTTVGSSVPWSLNSAANTTNSAPPPRDASEQPPFSGQPFWNGATLPPQASAPPVANSYSSNNGAAYNANTASPPWWAADPTGNSGAAPSASSFRNDPAQPGPSLASNTAWNPNPNSAPQANASNLAARQQAYQLAMSAGPGTMFPITTADGTNAAMNAAAPLSGPTWGTDTTNPYPEVRATSGWETPPQGNSPAQWQDAPTQLAPRSPTDNWNSPASTSWPPAQEATPSPRGTAPMPPDQTRLPTINPAQARNVGNGGPPPQGQSQPTTRNSGPSTGSGIVPAWHNAPAQTRYNDATSVQQWPYAPQ